MKKKIKGIENKAGKKSNDQNELKLKPKFNQIK